MKIIFVVPNKAKLLNDLFLNQVGSGIKMAVAIELPVDFHI